MTQATDKTEHRATTEVGGAEDFTKPLIRRKTLTARNAGSMRTVIDVGEAGQMVTDEPVAHGGTGEGPTPLQTVLGALCGCESVTFNRTAAEMGLEYRGITFEAEFRIDIRGRMGKADVRPHFQTVRVEARVDTDASDEELARVVEETERRCPVFNLISDANVKLQMRWLRGAAHAAA